jgi:tRNA A37 methylthiotransferase MiaB
MRIALASSLHLDHGAMSLDVRSGAILALQSFVPVGLLSLKAFADRALEEHHRIEVVELNTVINAGALKNASSFYQDVAAHLLEAGDELVGLMTDADSLHHTVAIANQIRRLSPESLVCVGGPASSPLGARFLQRFASFDFLVRGEGEEAFTELVAALEQGKPLRDIAGLVWRERDRVISNCPRALIQDLDRLPIPAFEAYPQTDTAALYLDVGRGCPFKCSFCATAPFWERRFRMKSIERILEEMRLLRDRWGRTQVNFSHDIFTADKKWTHRFCAALREAELGVDWTCSTRTDVIDPKLLERMAESGCVEIYFGIETGAPDIQRRIEKDLNLDEARTIVAATAAAGIRPVTGFIVGYPFETEETFSQTLARFFEFLAVGGFRAHLFSLCPFHEAPMFAQHSATARERAQYFDLPLHGEAAAVAEELLATHPDIFASAFRYAAPSLSPGLVAATEEISTPLVVLRRLWPLLLPHYTGAFEWYRRWVAFIGQENERSHPGTRLRYYGGVRELLRFVSCEVARLGLVGTPADTLVRYEFIKSVAATALPSVSPPSEATEVHAMTPLVRTGRFLAMPFDHELCAVLNTPLRQEASLDTVSQSDWIVFLRRFDGALQTVQMSTLALRVLELAEEPKPLQELVHDALLCRRPASDSRHANCLSIVSKLINLGILTEARHNDLT